ncbi:HTH-type transcriptional regulator CynR [Vibrio aerogenes CECT 7868]|uniref:HTH-type transcriptional regulator CynR n=1 Tax=Vibrio aerogenes CECT 7868 TaxID=1216006 RepID=A0A1M5XDR4_9VIBR|nr:LysR family transcriptional regulator [Vibrio aerogenes]SHH97678.1 HTH-type transcriptional regulator CynR [Vibrio aerogenes CECT 7868]
MAKSLNYIIEVAELGNLNKAAAALEITSSALSKYIISKEKELGVDLFERVGKKFVLTYAGQRYVQWAKKISQMQNKMDEELKSIAACRSGIIYFGFQLMMSKVVIADIIPQFKAQYPGIDIVLKAHATSQIIKMLEENQLDFAITTVKNRSDDFMYEHLAFAEVVLGVPKDHPLIQTAIKKDGFRYPWVDIQDFKDEHFVALFQDQEMRRLMDILFDKEKISPTMDIQVPTSELALLSVSNHYGVTVTLDTAIHVTGYKDEIVPLSFGERPEHHELVIIWHKNHRLQNFSQGLFETCAQYYRSLF